MLKTNLFKTIPICAVQDFEGTHCPEEPTETVLRDGKSYKLCSNCATRWRAMPDFDIKFSNKSHIEIITCNCLTKTPEPKYHDVNCPVYIHAEIKDNNNE
jgi:hypothetical protein